MAPIADPLTCKELFLQENQSFSEMELTEESKPIGKLHDFDLLEHEIWLLQCPKGMDVTELENQKLRIPGRSNINSSEAVSMEFIEGREQHAFAYCNRKGRYDLRLLPVRGTIVVRDRLKAAETITAERAGECCSPTKRVPLPASIRVRHPLLGVQYEDKLELDKSVVKRLNKADEISAQILRESLNKKSRIKSASASGKTILKQDNKTSLPVEINSADEDDVEFVSEEKLKTKKSKRKHNESNVEANASDQQSNIKKKKSTKSKKNEDVVSKDLQWLQNI